MSPGPAAAVSPPREERRRAPAQSSRILAAAVAVGGPALVSTLGYADVSSLAPAFLYVLAIALATLAGGLVFGLVAGAVSFVGLDYYFTEPYRTFGLPTAEDVVIVAAFFVVTAVGIAQVVARQRRARALAEDAADRANRLQRAANALSVAVTPADVLDGVMTEAVQAAEARAGLIALVTEDGAELEVVAQRGYDDTVIAEWARFSITADLPLSEAVRTGEPVFIRSQAERMRRYPALDSVAPTHALVCLPLVVEKRTIGGLTFSFGQDQDFDDDRLALKIALARLAAQALDRVRLYERERATSRRFGVLARASEILASSLDFEATLRRLAQIAVPALADWCAIDIVGERGAIERLAVAHQDPAKVVWANELRDRFPPDPDAPTGVPNVIRTGRAEFLAQIPQDVLDEAGRTNPGLADVIGELGLRSWICVPLKARGEMLGALSLITSESGRVYGQADLELALDLANRAGVAVDNARLFQEAERRGEAARALRYVGDAVILVDRTDIVRYWNPAAEFLIGCAAGDAVGRKIESVVPGWEAVAGHVAAAPAAAGEIAASVTCPLTIEGEERWLSAAAVEFDEGIVYALRDVSEQHALERARADFVATASHELRTPLAAVFGAARTLLREDVDIGTENRDVFLRMIEAEAGRLTVIVNQILLAGELASGNLQTEATPCDLRELVESAVETTRVAAPESVRVSLRLADDVQPVHCDEGRLRQVVLNLLDNAVKYSPNGGDVTVEVAARDGRASIAVRDEGLGIPAGELERIFERFYRLDPSLTRGVGGSGLGLYISRELVDRMGGSLTVSSEPGRGSTFTIELPVS